MARNKTKRNSDYYKDKQYLVNEIKRLRKELSKECRINNDLRESRDYHINKTSQVIEEKNELLQKIEDMKNKRFLKRFMNWLIN